MGRAVYTALSMGICPALWLLLFSVVVSSSLNCAKICSNSSFSQLDCSRRFGDVDDDARLSEVPTACIPSGVTVLLLNHHDITELGPNEFSNFTQLTEISLEYNRISTIHSTAFDGLHQLVIIKLHHNLLTEFPIVDLRAITVLELTENKISSVKPVHLRKLTKLKTLNLRDNLITAVEDFTFVDNCQLEYLDLKRNPLKTIGTYAMVGTAITRMDISETPVTNFPTAGLKGLRKLYAKSTPDLKSFPSRTAFPSIRQLNLTYPSHCCMYESASYKPGDGDSTIFVPTCSPSPTPTDANSDLQVQIDMKRSPAARCECVTEMGCLESPSNQLQLLRCDLNSQDTISLPSGPVIIRWCRDLENATATPVMVTFSADPTFNVLMDISIPVICAPEPDNFNSCDDVMGNWFLRVFVWIVIIVNFGGNFTVVFVFLVNFKRFNAVKLLLCNMAVADGLMGVYLMSLAIVDAATFGDYADHAIDWKTGGGCQAIGFLSVFASLLALYSLVAITIERFYTLHYAIYGRKLEFKHAFAIVAIGWVYAVTMATLPLVGVSDYTSTAICLPFDLSGGGQVYLTFGLCVNLVAFIVIATIYTYLLCSIVGRGPRASGNDFKVFRRMMLLVFVDFCCWMPIIVIGLISAYKEDVAVSLESAKWLVVFVYPLNSCANPFLYAVFTKPFKRDFFEFWHRFGLFEEQFYRHNRPTSVRRASQTVQPGRQNQRRNHSSRLGSDATTISMVSALRNGQVMERMCSGTTTLTDLSENVMETTDDDVFVPQLDRKTSVSFSLPTGVDAEQKRTDVGGTDPAAGRLAGVAEVTEHARENGTKPQTVDIEVT